MTDPFRSRIRASLADANLQAALDANAEKRIKGRKEAFASLNDAEGRRALARQVRAEVISHLDDYLNQFLAQATAHGMQVHRAANAEEALKIVLDIAQQQGAHLVAKSKTMVSEEIGLNHALEKNQLRVVETDLGEYIVQLRGEPPSHIITPAVHLRRHDVGKLFQEKLGLAYTDDISVMTDAARRTLRQVFMEADIGISGVNFGVAETGMLCVVTNEGNGRMVTTVPDTHIALMGIERLVPGMKDLALMLSLLPRFATGQKLSVYTSLISGPRRDNDPDGPIERHVILVDNGRSAIKSSALGEILYCIRCGACLNACPVFREIGGHAYVGTDGQGTPYSGPMGSIVSPAMFGWCEYGHLARASSLCGACKEACPVDIDLPRLLVRVRAGLGPGEGRPQPRHNAPAMLAAGLSIYSTAASSAWLFQAAQKLAAFWGRLATIFHPNDPWIRLPAFSGWGYSKDFPAPAAQTFRSRFKKIRRGQVDKLEEKALLPARPDLRHQGGEHGSAQDGNRVERFAAEIKNLGGAFYRCNPGEAAGKVAEILGTRNISLILAWDAARLPESLLDELKAFGVRVIEPGKASLEECSKVKAGLTGADAGVAETGSLLLLGGEGQALSASLLPEIHIAVLQEKDIYWQLDQVLVLDALKKAPAAVLVSGPSRTADIEMTLTIGVHGPGELDVICITSQ